MTGQQAAPVAVMGGTFDPIHYGHLRPAIELLEALNLSELRLIPGRVPPHRPQPRQSAAIRAELLDIAVGERPGLVVDRRELLRAGPSYTIDTLRELRAEIGPDRPLIFILGSDAFRGLPSWHDWSELTAYAHLLVTTRGGDRGELPAVLADWLATRWAGGPDVLRDAAAGRVCFHSISRLEISATTIRQLLACGYSAAGLMPDTVWARVSEGLYGYPQI